MNNILPFKPNIQNFGHCGICGSSDFKLPLNKDGNITGLVCSQCRSKEMFNPDVYDDFKLSS